MYSINETVAWIPPPLTMVEALKRMVFLTHRTLPIGYISWLLPLWMINQK